MTVIESCGCVFCDLGLQPIHHEDGRRFVHRYEQKRRVRYIECTKRNDSMGQKECLKQT